jgi:hypothetical protein
MEALDDILPDVRDGLTRARSGWSCTCSMRRRKGAGHTAAYLTVDILVSLGCERLTQRLANPPAIDIRARSPRNWSIGVQIRRVLVQFCARTRRAHKRGTERFGLIVCSAVIRPDPDPLSENQTARVEAVEHSFEQALFLQAVSSMYPGVQNPCTWLTTL